MNNSTTDLDTYYRWAAQCVCRFAPRTKAQHMLHDSDILAEIVSYLIKADLKWNGKGSKTGYRKAQGKFAVKRIVYRRAKKEHKFVSLDTCGLDTSRYSFVTDKSTKDPNEGMEQKENMGAVVKLMGDCLTVNQRRVVEDYYLNDKTFEEIGPSRQAAQQCLWKAMKKLRRIANR